MTDFRYPELGWDGIDGKRCNKDIPTGQLLFTFMRNWCTLFYDKLKITVVRVRVDRMGVLYAIGSCCIFVY